MLVGTVALLVALLEGGILWSWASPVSIGLLVGSLLVLVAFVLVERRAAEPVLPLWVFRHRVVGAAMGTSLVVGVLLLGLTSYVPLFAQGVLGTGAIVAGLRPRGDDHRLADRRARRRGACTCGSASAPRC